MAVGHRRDFERFDAGLRKEKPEEVEKWEAMLAEWNDDKNNIEETPCPYVVSDAGTFHSLLSRVTFSHSLQVKLVRSSDSTSLSRSTLRSRLAGLS